LIGDCLLLLLLLLPTTDAQALYITELRIAFALVVVLKFLVIAYLYKLCKGCAINGNVEVTEKGLDGVEAKKTLTVQEYDCAQVTKSIGQAAVALAITCGVHYKWGNPTPLLFQCLMTPIGLLDDSLVKIHLLGHAATGKLQRPFKATTSPMQELFGGAAVTQASSEAPAIDQGKKRGKKDKKSD